MSLLPIKADRRIFYPRMKYPPLAFSSVDVCKIDVFTSNIMVLHHKMSQTVRRNLAVHRSVTPFVIRQPIRRPCLLERVYKPMCTLH